MKNSGKKKTTRQNSSWPKQPIVKLEKPHKDSRGAIQPLVDQTMQSALLISSKKGTIRANHYHKTDWHYCYVVSGAIEYYHRPTGSKKAPKKVLVKQGQVFFTPPLVDHTMKFPADTVFLTLSRNPRDQKAYEKDVVRVQLAEG